jgi:predicted secreted protein
MAETRLKGQKLRLYVRDGQMVRLLGQISVAVNLSAAKIEGRDVDSGRWPDNMTGDLDGSVAVSGQMIQNNRAYRALRHAMTEGDGYAIEVMVLAEYPDGTVTAEGGLVTVDSCNYSAARNETVKFDVGLSFAGSWREYAFA